MSMMYTSELAASALGMKPTGSRHEGPDCVCAMCQRAIHHSDLSERKDLARTFMDFGHLAQSDYLCGYCAATSNQAAMRDLQRSVICRDGIYNLNTDDSRAWFWLTPPEPPFAVVINHNTMGAFHYYWRTPVTLDTRLVTINVDGTIYQVRRNLVVRAIDVAQRILKAYNDQAGKRKTLKSPFITLARDPGSKPRSVNGHIATDIQAFARNNPAFQTDVEFLDTLGVGELIALSPFLKQNPATPTQPEFIRSV